MPPKTDSTTKNFEKKVPLTQRPLSLRGFVSEKSWTALTYEQRDLLINLDTIPESIADTLSKGVWDTLSHKQRLEALISYQLIPSIPLEGDGRSATIEAPKSSIQETVKIERGPNDVAESEMQGTVEIKDSVKTEFEEVKERIRNVELKTGIQESDDLEFGQNVPEITTVPSSSQEPSFESPSIPHFTGYQPSKDLLQEIEVHVNGDPRKSKTWTANIINKIWIALVPQDK